MKDKNIFLSRFIEICEDYMINHLSFNKKSINSLIKDFRSRSTITEFSHTPSFFHVGIYRSYLTMHNYANNYKTSMVFCPNDHLDLRAVKEIRMIPFMNQNNTLIAKPPMLGIKKKFHRYSLHKFQKPSIENISKLCERVNELYPKLKNNIEKLQDIMIECSEKSISISDWFINLTFNLTKRTCLVFPTSRYNDLFNLENINIGNNSNIFLWVHCSKCGARMGKRGSEKKECNICSKTIKKDFFPNVVLRQNLVNQLNIKYRICGRKKSYQYISDKAKCFTDNVPLRVNIESNSIVLNKRNIEFKKFNIIQLYVLNSYLSNNLEYNINKDWKIFIE